MKNVARFVSLFMIFVIGIMLCSCNGVQKQEEDPTVQPQTEAPDLTGIHGYFDDEDHAKIYFRGETYYHVFLTSGELILSYLTEEAYITSSDITDDELAKSEGAVVYFSKDEAVPEYLKMSYEDYFKGDNYNPDMYPENLYFCKKKDLSVIEAKATTYVYDHLYVSYVDEKSFLGTGLFSLSVCGHEMLDDETTEVITSTVKNDTDDTLSMDTVYSSDYSVFIVHRCDKNMLVDPLNDEYIIIRTNDNEYYIGDWYSVAFNRVSEENEKLIADLMEKYSDTVELMTDVFKELYFTNQAQAVQS